MIINKIEVYVINKLELYIKKKNKFVFITSR